MLGEDLVNVFHASLEAGLLPFSQRVFLSVVGVCLPRSPLLAVLWSSWLCFFFFSLQCVRLPSLCSSPARLILQCACVRYWPCRVCVSLALSLHYFQCNRIGSIYFSSITLSHDISKQIQHRARIGKIFDCWHLAIAITSSNTCTGQCYHYQVQKSNFTCA